MRTYFLLSLFFVFIATTPCKAQLIPDSTYGQNGYFITNYPGLGAFAYKIHELDNGDLLAIGTDQGEIRVWKYNPSGQLITSFGTNGIASNPTLDAEPGTMHTLYDYEIYDNGKILILSKLGEHNLTHFDSSKYAIALTSFNADGSINTAFNSNGYFISKPNSLYEYNPYSLLMDKEKNNDIYVGGEAYEKGHSSCPMGTGKWFVSKYKSNGTPELSFNGNGYLIESAQTLFPAATSPQGRLRDMGFMDNGSIRVVGAFHNLDRGYFDFALKQNGSFDSTFGTNGITIYPVNYDVLHIETGTWAKILKDSSVLFYTKAFLVDSSIYRMVKHKKNGTIDNNYGINGLFTFKQNSTNNAVFAYKSDNSMLMSYYNAYGTNQKIEFMHLLPQGALDNSFGSNGWLATQPIASDVFVNASSLFDIRWNKYETHLFLSASKQPTSFNSFGIFKYKWPGLTPLTITSIDADEIATLYPNPIQAGQQFYLQTAKGDIGAIECINIQGMRIAINSTKISQDLFCIQIPAEMPCGHYFISYTQNNQKQIKRIVVQ